MPFVKGQSGNSRTREFVDRLLHLYTKGTPVDEILHELNITRRSFNHYIYGDIGWFNNLSNHQYEDIKRKRSLSELYDISAEKDFLLTREKNREKYLDSINNKFYVYTHLDKEGVVFYVGKGTRGRVYSKAGRTQRWENIANDGFSVNILQGGLSEEDAVDLEDSLIENPPPDWNLVNVHRSKTNLDYSSIDWCSLFYYDETSPTCLRYKVDNNGLNQGKRYAHDVAGFVNTCDKYKRYKVGYKGKEYMVHRIVYQMFNGDIRPDMVVNHINTNPQDNRISNLEQVTTAENNRKQKHHIFETLHTSNTSGNSCFRFTETEGGTLTCQIFIPDVCGKTIAKKISCNKYGKEEAMKVALKYIEDMRTLIETERKYLENKYAIC